MGGRELGGGSWRGRALGVLGFGLVLGMAVGEVRGQIGRDQPGAIGAVVLAEEGGFRLQEVLPASPAEQAGLRVGDLIVKIGEVLVADLDPNEALLRLRGRAFTRVRLTVTRLGEAEPRVVEVFRAPLDQFHGPR
ncbi:MAG: PDZ domain-containing protein [Verrucomicrobiia bacterium]